MTSRLETSRGLLATLACAAAVLAAIPGTACAQAQEVADLYPPQPPANAAYLRVVNTSAATVQVVLPGSIGAAPQNVPRNGATRMSVVPLATPLQVKPVGALALPAFSAADGDVVTLALSHDAQGWHGTRIVERRERGDGLKATLHAYNVAAACVARITLGVAGAEVFSGLAAGQTQARAINPVTATLVAYCGAAASAPLTLPALRSGDSYSLFIGGDAAHPTLSGTTDAVAWPPAHP